ncbi:cyclic nucleotide-binding domain-containing protein [Lampropedia aestuarii]|uniref:Cyclic nucleotide-binding domain-containing protein n=2 Tax=Lampropedia aestuarii TaxID=2562762 RepID=A0A4S5BV08_9BURK|nr:cyclic nucleotide-binding domain-containing protein [Lampropedia aestuarii]
MSVRDTQHPIACSACNLRQLCMPAELDNEQMALVDHLVQGKRRVARGQSLFHSGMPFEALFAIRTGAFKTCMRSAQGHEQVFGFQIAGDLLGLDGFVSGQYCSDAIALEDAQVCVMPVQQLQDLSEQIPALARHLQRIMSAEIVQERSLLLLLGGMRAEERLAAFLLHLTERMAVRGFSSQELVLCMSRQDIGSCLGLQLETVSRAFGKLVDQGLIAVDKRHVRICNAVALKAKAQLA